MHWVFFVPTVYIGLSNFSESDAVYFGSFGPDYAIYIYILFESVGGFVYFVFVWFSEHSYYYSSTGVLKWGYAYPLGVREGSAGLLGHLKKFLTRGT